ncbi:hypothetical protein EYC84_005521 [Monilinia fructicola]|uniref:Uncharacterized protein n=1 Tax=Monilinia fructicola TaxID=38448 RepID=A0A5M9K1W7_MONFR|nr:hypothetical protein EYC84_005521 [Monilinia fructicola]
MQIREYQISISEYSILNITNFGDILKTRHGRIKGWCIGGMIHRKVSRDASHHLLLGRYISKYVSSSFFQVNSLHLTQSTIQASN